MEKSEIGNLSDKQVEKLHSDLIREKMDKRTFYNWLIGWKDLNQICQEVEQNWGTEIKREELYEYKDLL